MPFAELEHASLVDYVERNRNGAATWGFLHLAKTAGTSMAQSLSDWAARSYPLYLEDYDLSLELIDAGKFERVAAFARLQGSLPPADRYRAFFGHLRHRHLQAAKQQIPGLKTFTILRDPIARVISEYRYRLTPAYWTHESFAARFPTILDFARQPGIANVMTNSLTLPQSENIDQAIQRILEDYDFIGLSEYFPASASAVFRMMDIVHRPAGRLNETALTDRNNIQVGEEDIRAIEALNAADVRLYERVRDLLAPRLPAWEAYFETLPPSSASLLDLVAPTTIGRWEVQNGNQWIQTTSAGLLLHPNPGSAPPPRLRLAGALAPGRYSFKAEVVVADARCCPHRLAMSLGGAATPSSWSVAIDGAHQGPIEWRETLIEVSAPSDLRLDIIVGDTAADAPYSGTHLASATFTRF